MIAKSNKIGHSCPHRLNPRTLLQRTQLLCPAFCHDDHDAYCQQDLFFWPLFFPWGLFPLRAWPRDRSTPNCKRHRCIGWFSKWAAVFEGSLLCPADVKESFLELPKCRTGNMVSLCKTERTSSSWVFSGAHGKPPSTDHSTLTTEGMT